MGLGQPQITSTDRQHWERSTTLGNQGHENFVSIYIYGLSRLGNGWDNKYPSRSYFGYP